MQRRAAAVYVAFFLVVGAVSFSLIATASAPHFSVEDPEYTLEGGESFTVDGTQYNVQSIEAEMTGGGGGGHGGGGGATLERSATLNWTNSSARYTQAWENGSTVTYDGDDWNVSIEPSADPSEVTLREAQNHTAILSEDPAVENETTTVDGQVYVVQRAGENGSRELIPAEDYFPAPATQQFSEGDEVQFAGNETTVAAVSNTTVTLEWFAPQTNEIAVEDTANVSIGANTYFAHFPNNETLALTQDYGQYQAYQEQSTAFKTHSDGLWGVTLLSGLISVFVTGLAYLPSRY
ncbi:hypothetical protein [Halorarum halobium]|uniref:hypothetical protein n=1 Tax=Halorarum halobium TaxID=3075121 RepID=UPI0028ABB26A|nr:hypothetical protein [Halobaculum sp. XH14]